MSFSRDVKNEILSKDINEDCCCLAFLSGLFASSANIEIKNEVELFHSISKKKKKRKKKFKQKK